MTTTPMPSGLPSSRTPKPARVRLYATGEWSQLGGRFYALHVPTVDDIGREALVDAPLHFIDNAQDRPDRAPADTRLM